MELLTASRGLRSTIDRSASNRHDPGGHAPTCHETRRGPAHRGASPAFLDQADAAPRAALGHAHGSSLREGSALSTVGSPTPMHREFSNGMKTYRRP